MKNTLLSLAFGATLALAQVAPPNITPILPVLTTAPNLVIVSLGDSYASGEGNPNSVSSNGVVHWSSVPCHRSVNNGRRIASDRINQLDNVSTTFVDFSCSNAEIQAGILGPMVSTQAGAVGVVVQAQLDGAVQWQADHQGRRIDILMISIGGNDVGFGSVVRACMLPTDCSTDPVVTNSIVAINALLPGRLADLNTKIRQRLNVGKIYITPYSNPFHDEDGPFCGNFFDFFSSGDIAMQFISAQESQFLESHYLNPLNAELASFAAGHGWQFVTGVQDTYRPHGYCNGLGQRWINTLGDSITRQGDVRGLAHPNLAGHRAYADSLVAQATKDFNLQFQKPVITEIYERNDGINLPDEADFDLPGATLKIQAEVAMTADNLTVQLQHRVRNDILETSVPAFETTAMTDSGTGALNMFTAKIPGIQIFQKIEYRVVVTGTRNGVTETVVSNLQTIRVGDALLN